MFGQAVSKSCSALLFIYFFKSWFTWATCDQTWCWIFTSLLWAFTLLFVSLHRPRHTGPLCTELQAKVFQCYTENPQQTLLCSSLARQYIACVQQAKVSQELHLPRSLSVVNVLSGCRFVAIYEKQWENSNTWMCVLHSWYSLASLKEPTKKKVDKASWFLCAGHLRKRSGRGWAQKCEI